MPLRRLVLLLSLTATEAVVPNRTATLAAVVGTGGCTVKLDATKAIQWWTTVMGCKNGTITNCPGGSKCSDTEFMARSLAFGGAISLKPDAPAGCPGFACYEMASLPGKYFNLAQQAGFTQWLAAVGFSKSSSATVKTAPAGAILLVQAYGAPALSLGGGLCSTHTPLVHAGPHCAAECSFFAPVPSLLKGIYIC